MGQFDMAVWAWPQWAYAGVIAFNLIAGSVLDGTPRTGTHRFSVSVIGSLIGFGILWAGGFWG